MPSDADPLQKWLWCGNFLPACTTSNKLVPRPLHTACKSMVGSSRRETWNMITPSKHLQGDRRNHHHPASSRKLHTFKCNWKTSQVKLKVIYDFNHFIPCLPADHETSFTTAPAVHNSTFKHAPVPTLPHVHGMLLRRFFEASIKRKRSTQD